LATQEYKLGLNQYLAKNQTYTMAFVDLRGSANRGEKLRQSIYRSLGSAEAADIGKIVE